MKSKIWWMLGVAGMGGFFAGWLMFGSPPETVTPVPAPTVETSQAASTRPARVEFPLKPADAASDRETPAVAVDGQGRVLLAWATQTGDLERTLMLARSTDGGLTFDAPTAWRKVPIYRYSTKSKGKEVSYSTHVLPRLASSGDSIHLGWVEAVKGGPKVIDYLATSTDGGKTFAEPVASHGAEAVKPGFTGLSVAPDGSVLSAWLDGRTRGQRPYASIRNIHSDGFEPEQLVYEGPEGKGVCPCCDVAIAQSSEGTKFVAFRNNDGGNRDIVVSRSRSNEPGYSTPVAVAPDHWKLDGCPHDGPSLALVGGRLNLAWMDAHTGKNRVYLATSPMTEIDFKSRELTPGSTTAQGHPKLATHASGALVAVWDESIGDEPAKAEAKSGEHGHGHAPALTGGGRAVMVAIGDPNGLGTPKPVAPRLGAFQLQPSLAIGPDGTVFVAWNELDETGKKVVFARVTR